MQCISATLMLWLPTICQPLSVNNTLIFITLHLHLCHIEFNKGKAGEMAQPIKARFTG